MVLKGFQKKTLLLVQPTNQIKPQTNRHQKCPKVKVTIDTIFHLKKKKAQTFLDLRHKYVHILNSLKIQLFSYGCRGSFHAPSPPPPIILVP